MTHLSLSKMPAGTMQVPVMVITYSSPSGQKRMRRPFGTEGERRLVWDGEGERRLALTEALDEWRCRDRGVGC